MITQLLSILQAADLLLSDAELASFSEAVSLLGDEDIADALWLAARLQPISALPKQPAEAPALKTEADPELTEPIELRDEDFLSAPEVAAYLPDAAQPEAPQSAAPEQGLRVQVQAAPTLLEAQKLGKALRPLMRRAPALTQTVLDEASTVEQIAERNLWMPVIKPAQERWLDLELVIEASEFSFVWEATLAEFRQILERQGAFRNVRSWWIEGVDAGELRLSPRRQPVGTAAVSAARSPKELVDSAGRRLVLLVSDCRSPVWQQGKIHPWLKLWSQHGPTAVVQLLPEWLWEQSELDVGYPAQVSALLPGAPNHKLQLHEPSKRSRTGPSQDLTLPVVTLTETSLKQWALVVAAAGRQRTAARRFDLGWVASPERDPRAAVVQPQSAAERLELFAATASLVAQRLASMMAAVPVDLSVVNLIQKCLLPEAKPIHVAEIYASPLLEPVSTQQPQGSSSQYDFAPGVRGLLNQATPVDDTLTVLNQLSKEIANTLGITGVNQFTALLLPKSDWTEAVRASVLPFAQIATQVLHQLGGDYGELARTVERAAARHPGWIQPQSTSFPPLQTLTFETAQLIEAEAEIPSVEIAPFTFEVATLERERLFRRWRIQRQRQQAQRYIEHLGNGISITMVAIPGGSFMMGSPEDEPERYDDEGPQHNVSVEPFFMGQYPITQAQWRVVAGLPEVNQALEPDPARFKGDNHPVEQVSWNDAIEFCARLSAHTQRRYRLPTEAEWEYACRAGTTTPFHFGEMITTKVANYDGDYTYNDGPKGENRGTTTPVDHFGVANAFGLSDMHGNVWEWCEDHWHDNYEGAPTDGSAWLSEAESESEDLSRVRRGGSWFFNPWDCRSAIRYGDDPRDADNDVGFRIVCSAPRALP